MRALVSDCQLATTEQPRDVSVGVCAEEGDLGRTPPDEKGRDTEFIGN
jgi:hypothetical protein